MSILVVTEGDERIKVGEEYKMAAVDLFSLSESELRKLLTDSGKEHGISEEEIEKLISVVLQTKKQNSMVSSDNTEENGTVLTTTKRDEEGKIGEDGVLGGKKSRKGLKGGRKTRKGGRKH